jgi:hypothetical protein
VPVLLSIDWTIVKSAPAIGRNVKVARQRSGKIFMEAC